MLKVIRATYKNIINNINFTVPRGSLTAILGPNGSGKTTLIKTIMRFFGNGEFIFDNYNFNKLERKELASIIAYIPQSFPDNLNIIVDDFLLFNSYFILENRRFLNEKIEYALNLCGIDYIRNRNINKLSGGEKQRLLLASVLIGDAPLWICDEPTSALDPKSRFEFYKILWNYLSNNNKTILWITHDITRALMKADYILGLKNGKKEFFLKKDEIKKEDIDMLYEMEFQILTTKNKAYIYIENNI